MSLSTQKSEKGSIGKYKTRSITYSLLLLIIFINFVVVIFGIKSSSLTLDESYSHWFASLSYQKLWSEVPVFSIHPTLYYFLLKFWMSIFGDGVIALRSLSASFGIIAIPFVFIAGRNLFNGSNANQVGLLAALFFSISLL